MTPSLIRASSSGSTGAGHHPIHAGRLLEQDVGHSRAAWWRIKAKLLSSAVDSSCCDCRHIGKTDTLLMSGGTLGTSTSAAPGDGSDLTIARAPLVPPAAAQVHAAAHPEAAAAAARGPAGAVQVPQVLTPSGPQPVLPAGMGLGGGMTQTQMRARPSEQGHITPPGPGVPGGGGGGAPGSGPGPGAGGPSGRLNRGSGVRASTAVGQLSGAGTRARPQGAPGVLGARVSAVGVQPPRTGPPATHGWQRGMQSSFSGFAVLPEQQ
jgi:hypothetical protein